MKNPSHSIAPSAPVRYARRSALCVTLLATTLLLVALSCKREAATKPPDVDYYTCTMHPSVKKQSPNDKCPICSMDLEPVKKRETSTKSDEKTDAKSMGMSAEAHSKMQEGKGQDGMKDMKGMPGMKGMNGMKGMDAKGKDGGKDMKGHDAVGVQAAGHDSVRSA